MLDVLLSTEQNRRELASQLRDLAGVFALHDEVEAEIAWDVLSPELARQTQCVAVRPAGEPDTIVAAADPWDEAQVRTLVRSLGWQPVMGAASSGWLRRAGILGAAPEPEPSMSTAHAADGEVVAFVNGAILGAVEMGASDIHFECSRRGLGVKFRVNGVLVEGPALADPTRAEEVISRIKVLAQLDITERRLPQDGRFRWASSAAAVDMRVSIMPSIHAEDAVLRVLDKSRLLGRGDAMNLDALGFEPAQADAIRELCSRPHGMLLATGPTGSGKTTTLYAALTEVNTGQEKIITIEDPVEYELAGVLQIPVNERKGLTFAKGLRSILRHDPDRLLVGEIRDAETAEIAVQSALTGHQVFTTVHANNLFDVLGRFRHFGIDLFGFMASLNGVVVQRLLRRLCPTCHELRALTSDEQRLFDRMGIGTHEHIPVQVGCAACANTGYRGRQVIAEVHEVDDGLRDLVISGAPMSAIRRHVDEAGVVSLFGQGLRRVIAREASLDEVRRVIGWA